MLGRPIMIVSLTVDPEKEAEFNDFYHHRYIPRLLDAVPELISARRYEEFNVEGSLRWFTKRFLTIYEFASEAVIDHALKKLVGPDREQERAEWDRWKATHLHDVSRKIYGETYAHARVPWDGPFGSRPFFLVSVEVNPLQEPEFTAWYETRYLPKNLADVPTWAACRRYTSLDREPTRYQTIYEAWSEEGLKESLGLMRAPHRLGENAAWHKWDSGERPAITWEDATSFTPIFRYPG